MIKAVVFDLMKVLVIHQNYEITQAYAKRLGVDFLDLQNLRRAYTFAAYTDEVDPHAFALKNETKLIPPEEFTQLIIDLDQGLTVDERMLSLVKEIKSNYKVGILTNIGRNAYNNVLKDSELAHMVDAVTSSCDIHYAKPHPEAYHHILDQLAVSAYETIFIDDRIENIESAIELGIHAIQHSEPHITRNEVSAILTSFKLAPLAEITTL